MGQSLTKLNIHIIFHKKYSSPIILEEDMDELWSYIGSVIKDNDSIPIKINGVEDHVHILCVLSKNIAFSKLLEEIKKQSSRWIKNKGKHYSKFYWQGGYGGFSVSPSLLYKTINYIENQKEHHKKLTFKEEYLQFLKEYGVDFDETFLWSD